MYKNDQPKTLEALRKALQTTNGVHDTVCVLWGANESSATTSAFIGDDDVLAATLLTVLGHVVEQRATPAEMAITRAVLMAVAAADVENKGALSAAIDTYRNDITSGRLTVRRGGQKAT